jgi:hypothetical protein
MCEAVPPLPQYVFMAWCLVQDALTYHGNALRLKSTRKRLNKPRNQLMISDNFLISLTNISCGIYYNEAWNSFNTQQETPVNYLNEYISTRLEDSDRWKRLHEDYCGLQNVRSKSYGTFTYVQLYYSINLWERTQWISHVVNPSFGTNNLDTTPVFFFVLSLSLRLIQADIPSSLSEGMNTTLEYRIVLQNKYLGATGRLNNWLFLYYS